MADIYNIRNWHSGKTPADRFWEKVDKNGPVPEHRPDLGPCWLWIAHIEKDGYGHFRLAGTMRKAHRVSYEMETGQIPEGCEVDHLCRVRRCVKPAHLEAVPHLLNVRRGEVAIVNAARQHAKTHCPHGHPYSGEHLYITPDGRRQCRTCHIKRDRLRRLQEATA